MARRDPPVRRTKQDVADAALALFCERGYHAVTVDEIAAAAGVTKGAFYYYFADKEDLATDLWRALWTRLAAAAVAVFDPELDVATNLKRCLRAVIDAVSGLEEARFFLRDAWVLPSVEVAGRSDQRRATMVLSDFLQRSASVGGLDGLDARAAAPVLLGAFAEAMLHILSTGRAEPALAVLDRVIDAVVGPAGAHPRSVEAPPDPLAASAGQTRSTRTSTGTPRRAATLGGGRGERRVAADQAVSAEHRRSAR